MKTLSGSSSIFSLKNHNTFSQTQTGATVPLKRLFKFFYYFNLGSTKCWCLSNLRNRKIP
jgi:hypothetical protein